MLRPARLRGRPDGDPRSTSAGSGIFDEDGDYEPLLIDWRAPAARPFYLATAARPQGVRRRRHIRTRAATVVGLDDEVLDLDAAATSQQPRGLTGEAALLGRARTPSRTGRMRDIVATIQAEQDRIIRADLRRRAGRAGRPGHRQDRRRAAPRRVPALHVPPAAGHPRRADRRARTRRSCATSSQVLPSLAETGVLLRTLGDLFPGRHAHGGPSRPEAAEVKGRPAMAEVLASAVRDRQRVPDDTVGDRPSSDGDAAARPRQTVRATPATGPAASGRPHNLARAVFDTEVIDALAEQVAERIGTDPYADDPLGGDDAPGDAELLGEADLAEIRRELRREPTRVQAALDGLWPMLTPQQLLADLFTVAERLAAAAAGC